MGLGVAGQKLANIVQAIASNPQVKSAVSSGTKIASSVLQSFQAKLASHSPQQTAQQATQKWPNSNPSKQSELNSQLKTMLNEHLAKSGLAKSEPKQDNTLAQMAKDLREESRKNADIRNEMKETQTFEAAEKVKAKMHKNFLDEMTQMF